MAMMAPAQDILREWEAGPRAAYQPPAALPQRSDIMEVVGGRDKGGIKVREGKDTASAELPERLATGSLVRAVEIDAGRLRYELLDGEGPESGWVSLRAGGRDLLVGLSQAEASTKEEAIQGYGLRLAESRSVGEPAAQDVFGARAAFHWWGGGKSDVPGVKLPGREVEAALEGLQGSPTQSAKERSFVDAYGERVLLCQHCQLPLGQIAYAAGKKKKKNMMHGECMAQHMVSELREQEEAHRKREAEVKRSRRAEFNIGWNASVIPSNATRAAKLGCDVVPQGLCCLVLDDEAETVRVAPTLEPGAAVNLEYLSIALQVRRTEGREPLFSLDPVDPTRLTDTTEASMQMKRFEPEWLAGTSVGEVMFQADYHLKELSMGEQTQPVVGMKSCFDYSKEEASEEAWNAREWFVVRKAEIHVSEDCVAIPFLKMGVEAREQLLGPDGLEDAALTRHDHPLVRYAEDFTQNFDLIAERKGVVYQLREVAKASVLAKFLLESGARLEESWFNLAEGFEGVCCLEVPQLWNHRFYSQVAVRDGAILDAEKPRRKMRQHGVYGGVDFGIDRFRLSAPSRVATSVVGGRVALGAPSSTLMAASQQRLTLTPQRAFARVAGPLSTASMAMAPSRVASVASSLGVPQRLAAPVSGMSMAAGMRAPSGALSMSASLRAPRAQGVDLNLDQFNLSEPTMAGGLVQAQDAGLVVGSSFWQSIRPGAESAIEEEDKDLFRGIFNPHLSDRREEGELFAPPPTGAAYMQKLRELLKAECGMRQSRRDHFLSSSFVEDAAGPLFPSSWTSTFQGKSAGGPPQGGMLQKRSGSAAETAAIREALRTALPAFDRQTEDGLRFRIYRLGSLEVRTTEEPGGEEEIGAIFSIKASMQAWGGRWSANAGDREKIVKATEYVERALEGAGWSRLYVVLETDGGHTIVTEKLEDGMATWQEDPQDLEDRNSLAKVVRIAEPCTAGITIKDIKDYQVRETREFGLGRVSPLRCEQYAQIVYSWATGQQYGYSSGFLRPRQILKGSKQQDGAAN